MRIMGWRERDWAKFTDEERAALYGGGRGSSLPPSAEGAAHYPQPIPPTRRPKGISRRRQRIGEGIFLGLTVLGALTFAYDHIHHDPARLITLQPALPLVTPQPPANVIAIRWRASDLAPAPEAGRVCVKDVRHGRICASYVIGEAPADTLTRQIEAMGLHVESDGSG
jgi:hypothetical protein